MVAIVVSARACTGIRMRFISSVRSVLRLVVLLVAIASLGLSAGADATEDARRKIGAEMAAGVQNNIPLRRLLIGKHIDEDGDYTAAAEQYRQIIRIQVEY